MESAIVKIGQNYNKAGSKAVSKAVFRTVPTESDSEKLPLHPVLVNIILANEGTIRVFNVNKFGLKRFSRVAKTQLDDKDFLTRNPAVSNIILRLPAISKLPPSQVSIQHVINWIEANKRITNPEPLSLAKLETRSIPDMIDVLAAATALSLAISPNFLHQYIYDKIRSKPLTAFELAFIWEHLPSHHVLVTCAVNSLTYWFYKHAIDEEENDLIEAYMDMDENKALKAMFQAQDEQQQTKRAERRHLRELERLSSQNLAITNGGDSHGDDAELEEEQRH